MTLIDKNGDTHCFEKDSEEEVEVQCIADDGEECQTQVSFRLPHEHSTFIQINNQIHIKYSNGAQ